MKSPVEMDPFKAFVKVCKAGYEWRKGHDGRDRLVSRPAPKTDYLRVEPPPTLFRDFADLSHNRGQIKNFANKLGGLLNSYAPDQAAPLDNGALLLGSSFGTWTKEMGDMQVLVQLWDAVCARRIGTL